jgi:D-alanyl-D-alanine carboxypeptidase
MTQSAAQLARAQDLQPLLDQVVAAGAPGVLARVQTPTDTVQLVSGLANRNTGAPMTPESYYRVGSVTKTFVATITLQLVDEGRLRLEDRVARWLPWLPRMLPHAETITLRQLLNHTSGIFNYRDDPAYLLTALTGKVFRPEELVLISALHPPAFEPGTDWKYSNTNYAVVGLIIEKVTGHSLGDELRTRLFHPLGLDHTTHPTSVQMPDSHPRGYYFLDGVGYLDITTTVHPSATWGAGDIISNAADLATFSQALLSGKLLTPDLLKAMQTTATNATGEDTGYGLGLTRLTTPCGTVWGHGGDAAGYENWIWTCPDGTHSTAIMMNISYPWPPQVEESFLRALVAALCPTLLEQAPAAAEITQLEHFSPPLGGWSTLTETITQIHRVTLNLNLLDLREPGGS